MCPFGVIRGEWSAPLPLEFYTTLLKLDRIRYFQRTIIRKDLPL